MNRAGRSIALANALIDSDDVFVAMIELGYRRLILLSATGLEVLVLGQRFHDEIR
jgi:hypothetical protein